MRAFSSTMSKLALCLCLLLAFGATAGILAPPSLSAQEGDCTNGVDDDNDGRIDCNDPDCETASCDDNFDCTINDECVYDDVAEMGSCEGQRNNPTCDDGDFCNGDEVCNPDSVNADPTTGCIDRPDPCGAGTTCNETDDVCEETDCDDGVDNDDDGDTDCADLDCDGLTCVDAYSCTGDSGKVCTGGACPTTQQSDAACDDGQFCTGTEECNPNAANADPNTGCETVSEPCTDPGADCDETNDVCTETDCSDSADNDNDLSTDCADSDCPCPTGSSCNTGTFPPTCEETDCADGVDNDGDGMTDCADPNCNGMACSDGYSCTDDSGKTCSGGTCPATNQSDAACDDGNFCNGEEQCNPLAANADPETGCETIPVCDDAGETCNTARQECEETACTDNSDNDDDGFTNCNDTEDCACPAGSFCSLSPLPPHCEETNCADGIDNDGDGQTDCLDDDCDGRACDDGFSCTDDTGKTCSSNACPTTQQRDARCNTGGDFCDGTSECNPLAANADPESGCELVSPVCTDQGETCDPDLQECVETSCSDAVDNDSDGRTDCNDAQDCPCPNGTTCDTANFPPTCKETQCGDGIDNDGNGFTDCADPNCDGRACTDGFTCTDDTGKTCSNGRCPASRQNDTLCDDGQFCTGVEECNPLSPNADPNSGCETVSVPCQGSGVGCDEGNDVCTETACFDGQNNDGNQGRDCLDPDCTCPTGSSCNTNIAECEETACGDGIDNDDDGLTDCEDPNCNGQPCDDGFACTDNSATTCSNGSCPTGTPDDTVCEDEFFCDGAGTCDPTSSSADPESGCVATNPPCQGPGVGCDEERDVCIETACFDGINNDGNEGRDCRDPDCVCPDGSTCNRTTAECVETNCTDGIDNDQDDFLDCEDPDCDGRTCNDDATCTTNDVCSSGRCVGSPDDTLCNDGASCTTDSCNPQALLAKEGSGCVNEPDNSACSDGATCTLDRCNPDSADADSEGCVNTPDQTACNDQIACTDDACDPADANADGTTGCVNDAVDSFCDDGIDCTVDSCSTTTGCENDPDDSVCDDGFACTDEVCDASNGCTNPAIADFCDDGIDCTDDRCDPGSAEADVEGCVSQADDEFCDDTLFCTGEESCQPTNPDRGADGCVEGSEPCQANDLTCVEDEDRCGEAEDFCRDGVDNDGDGLIDCADPDCPGFEPEDCDDGIDNDCDGLVDCDDTLDCGPDDDGDGFRAPPCGQDCDDSRSDVNPSQEEICDNQVDDDCDGATNCADSECLVDADEDGQIAQPCGEDCDDSNDQVFARNVETCDNGIDDDCDGLTDCEDPECLDQACDDGAACTENDTCTANGCIGTPNDSLCDDDVFCTRDRCISGLGCQNTPRDARCDNGLFCDGREACVPDDALADGEGCVDGEDPCAADEDCDEVNDACICALDDFEPDNACGQARPIVVDGALRNEEHSLCPMQDVDRVTWNATAGTQYTFFTTGGVDTMLIITDATCNVELARNNDCSPGDPNGCLVFTSPVTTPLVLTVLSGEGQPASAVGVSPDGEIIAPTRDEAPDKVAIRKDLDPTRAGGGGAGKGERTLQAGAGPYTLWYQASERACVPDGFEPGDSECGTATFITPETTPSTEDHTVCPPGDRDLWRFRGEAGVTYSFRTAGDTDTVVEVRTDDCGTVLASADSCDGDDNGCLEFTPDETAFYVVEVRGQNGVVTGAYQFIHSRDEDGGGGGPCEPDGGEPDDACSQAFFIPVGPVEQTMQRTLCPEGDQDTFRFSAEAGKVYRFATSGGLDTRILIGPENCSTALVDESSCGPDALNACAVWRATETGTFKVRVQGRVSGIVGPYTLHFQQIDCPADGWEPDDRCGDATALNVTTELKRQAHTICPGGEVDFYEFFAQEGALYRFFSEGPTDTGAAILDPNCSKFIVKDESSGQGENYDLLWQAPATGPMKVGVTGDAVGGPYDFFFQRVVQGPTCIEDPSEQDDTCAQGTVIVPMTAEKTMDRSLCPPDDRDHYTFQAAAGVTYELWTTGDTDTVCNVRDASCNKLVGNDDRNLPEDLNCFVRWTSDRDQTVHFRIRGFSRSQTVGEYTFHHKIAP